MVAAVLAPLLSPMILSETWNLVKKIVEEISLSGLLFNT